MQGFFPLFVLFHALILPLFAPKVSSNAALRVIHQTLIKLLGFTDEPISISEINISDVVKKHVLENNYDQNDLPLLVSSYEKETSEIKEVLFAIFIKESVLIADNSRIKTPYNLLLRLLQTPSLLNKSDLLAAQLKDLTREQAIECFTILRMDSLLTVFDGKWPSIEINDVNTSILKTLEDKTWISSFAEENDKPGYYRVRAKRKNESQDILPSHLL